MWFALVCEWPCICLVCGIARCDGIGCKGNWCSAGGCVAEVCGGERSVENRMTEVVWNVKAV